MITLTMIQMPLTILTILVILVMLILMCGLGERGEDVPAVQHRHEALLLELRALLPDNMEICSLKQNTTKKPKETYLNKKHLKHVASCSALA